MTIIKIGRSAACVALGAAALLLPASASLADGAPQAASGIKFIPPDYVFNSNIPSDIVTVNTGANGTQTFVDNLGWNTFIAVNWPAPATIDQRGVPDRQNVIGGLKFGTEGMPKVSPTGPVVWETYKNSEDIFLNPPNKPTSFDTPQTVPALCKAAAEKNPLAALHVLHATTQAFTSKPLIDLNGQKVWYEVRLNRAYYDYVVNNGFYNSKNQNGKKINFPSAGNTNLTAPVVKIKAAWKIMGPGDVQSRFYVVPALINDPATKTCTEQTVGLVGLHVVQKTQQFQQWAWATFEHADNAPDTTGPVAGVHYNFNNPSCPTAQCPPNTYPMPSGKGSPTQVVREVPINSTAAPVNAAFQTALKSLRSDNVWQYYMLVDSQWGPLDPPKIGTPIQPNYLSNTTMETYLQSPTDDPIRPHGCINCHGTGQAADKDLDFQLLHASPQNGQAEAIKSLFMH
jgi:hypothetical protein